MLKFLTLTSQNLRSQRKNLTSTFLNQYISHLAPFSTTLKKLKIEDTSQQTTIQSSISLEIKDFSPRSRDNTNPEPLIPTPNIIPDLEEKLLPREFFTIDQVTLAKNLLGKIIVRRVGNQVIKCKIVETESYGGVKDRACHGYGGKLTTRTKPLFLQGGHLYVYLIYGLSHLVNITATEEGEPTAVLIRAVEIVEGYDFVVANRNMKNLSKTGKELTNGPGKVTAAMKIDKSLTGYDMAKPGEFYVIEGDGKPFEIVVSKRINIDYAGEDIHKPWRFYIKDNMYVSVKGEVLEVITPEEFTKPVVVKSVVKKAIETMQPACPFIEGLEQFRFRK